MLRIAGYWLMYAVVGVIVLVMLIGGVGDLGTEDNSSPIRRNTKVIGAINGLAIGAALLGLYMMREAVPTARSLAAGLLYGGAACAAVLGVWTWVRLAHDLRHEGRTKKARRGRGGSPD